MPLSRRFFLSANGPRKLVEFPNVGHCPHDESPSLVNGLILDFLQHLSSKASKPA